MCVISKQITPNFPENKYFLPPDTHMHIAPKFQNSSSNPIKNLELYLKTLLNKYECKSTKLWFHSTHCFLNYASICIFTMYAMQLIKVRMAVVIEYPQPWTLLIYMGRPYLILFLFFGFSHLKSFFGFSHLKSVKATFSVKRNPYSNHNFNFKKVLCWVVQRGFQAHQSVP